MGMLKQRAINYGEMCGPGDGRGLPRRKPKANADFVNKRISELRVEQARCEQANNTTMVAVTRVRIQLLQDSIRS